MVGFAIPIQLYERVIITNLVCHVLRYREDDGVRGVLLHHK